MELKSIGFFSGFSLTFLASGLCGDVFAKTLTDVSMPPTVNEIYGPFENAGVTAIELDWLPDSLKEAVNLALTDSPLILASEAENAAARAELDYAKWQRYPSLTAELLTVTGGSNVADRDGFAANVALEQPIWAGGALVGQIDEARFNTDASAANLDATRQNLTLDIVRLYFEILSFDRRLKLLESGLERLVEFKDSVRRRVAQQIAPQADLTLVLSRMAQLEADIQLANEFRRLSYARLIEIVGREVYIDQPNDVDFSLVPAEALALEEAQSCSPAIEESMSLYNAAVAAYDTSKSRLQPRLALQLSQNELTGARAALVLRAQTGNGLSKLSNIRRALAETNRARAEMSQAKRQLRSLVAREYARFDANSLGLNTHLVAVEAATMLLDSYRRQFLSGRKTWLDVLNAFNESLSADLSYEESKLTMVSSATKILILTCRWRPQGQV